MEHTKGGRLNRYYFYNDGKRHGEYKRWHENGSLYVHCFYDHREGERKEWWKNGNLRMCCFYKDHERNGEYKYWLLNGKLWHHSLYKNNVKVEVYYT